MSYWSITIFLLYACYLDFRLAQTPAPPACTKVPCSYAKDELKKPHPFTPTQMQKAREKALEFHNLFRVWHNAPPMVLDDVLNQEAQEVAELNVRCKDLVHSDFPGGGENLYFMGWSAPMTFDPEKTAVDAVVAWYDEFCNTKAYPRGTYNHFTQLVWNASVHLGVGIAINDASTRIYVANRYYPQGNFVPYLDKEVGPLGCAENKICDGQKLKPNPTVGMCIDRNTGKAPPARNPTGIPVQHFCGKGSRLRGSGGPMLILVASGYVAFYYHLYR